MSRRRRRLLTIGLGARVVPGGHCYGGFVTPARAAGTVSSSVDVAVGGFVARTELQRHTSSLVARGECLRDGRAAFVLVRVELGEIWELFENFALDFLPRFGDNVHLTRGANGNIGEEDVRRFQSELVVR